LGIIDKAYQVKEYFMHGTSHYLGLDVHDAGLFGTLEDGNVITVEPGIYIPAGSNCDPKWWNIGVRIEDDILITETEPVILSAKAPRNIIDIEQLMKEVGIFEKKIELFELNILKLSSSAILRNLLSLSAMLIRGQLYSKPNPPRVLGIFSV